MFNLQPNEYSYNQLSGLRKKIKEVNQEKYLEESKQRFNKIVSKKMQTCFIGSLAAFEDTFGFLWGHGKSIEDLDDHEKEMKGLWDNVRTNVLNHGNQQLRSLLTEISNHTVSWQRYQTNFVIKKEN